MDALRNSNHRAEGLLGLASLVVLGLVSCPFVPTLEILLFPLDEPSAFSESSARWASLMAMSFCGYVVLGIARFLGNENGLVASVQRVAAFVCALSWLFFLFMLSMVASGDSPLPADLYIAIVLASASAASLIWFAIFGGGSFMSALVVSISTSVGLLVAMLFLDDGAVTLILARLGLVENPKELLYGSFFSWIPYIAPAGPLIWWSLKPPGKGERILLGPDPAHESSVLRRI